MGAMKNASSERKDARATASKGKQGKIPFSDFRFVRIELTEDEKQTFRALLDSGEFDGISPDDFVSQGCKVSFSAGDDAGTIICSVTCTDPTAVNAALVLTGRGRISTTALAVCMYKHIYLCSDGSWREGEARRGGGYSDIG